MCVYAIGKKCVYTYMYIYHTTINFCDKGNIKIWFLPPFSKGHTIHKVKESFIKPQNSSRVLVYHYHQCIHHRHNDYHLIGNYHIPENLLIILQVVSPSIFTEKSISWVWFSCFADGIKVTENWRVQALNDFSLGLSDPRCWAFIHFSNCLLDTSHLIIPLI